MPPLTAISGSRSDIYVSLHRNREICTIFTSAKEVMFSSAFVCLFLRRITKKLLSRAFTKYGGKVARGPRKKRLDVGAYVILQIRLQLGLQLGWGLDYGLCGRIVLHRIDHTPRHQYGMTRPHLTVVLHGVCLTVRILRDQRHRLRGGMHSIGCDSSVPRHLFADS